MDRPARLLVCSVYWGAIGHQVIALQVADWFRAANPDLHIAALLPATHAGLARLVPSVDEILSSRVTAMEPLPAKALAGIRPDWDYVVVPLTVPGTTPTLEAFYDALRDHVGQDCIFGPPGMPGMPARKPRPLRLRLPSDARREATRRVGADRPAVVLIPGSATGNGARSPSVSLWETLIDALLEMPAHPRVVLMGLTGSATPNRTKGFGRTQIEALRRGRDDVIDAFDLPLSSQLAIAERCAALVAPHTGFCFAIQAVGVPWVVLSGAEHHEYWLNGVPILPLYPDCPRYPCSGRRLAGCDEIAAGDLFKGQFPCLADEALLPRVESIVSAVADLLAQRVDYGVAAATHLASLRERGVGIRNPETVLGPTYRF